MALADPSMPSGSRSWTERRGSAGRSSTRGARCSDWRPRSVSLARRWISSSASSPTASSISSGDRFVPSAFDLVIRGGTVYDGSGAPGFRADVAVHGDRIVEIGTVRECGGVELDAGGHAVSPGFIDVHSHDDIAVL